MKDPAKFLDSEMTYFCLTIGDIEDQRRLSKVFALARHAPELAESIQCDGDVCYPKRLCSGCRVKKPYQATVDGLGEGG